jgi:bacterioferritin
MRGDPEIISLLNDQLTSELTAINQYFLHAKMQQNWGLTKLAAYTEMKHAEIITDRILFLEGLPNYQRLGTLRIGQSVKEQLEADLQIELAVVERLRPGITMCRSKADHTTANLFEEILADEEHHIDYIETNLELIERLGEQLYLAQLVDQPPTPG